MITLVEFHLDTPICECTKVPAAPVYAQLVANGTRAEIRVICLKCNASVGVDFARMPMGVNLHVK